VTDPKAFTGYFRDFSVPHEKRLFVFQERATVPLVEEMLREEADIAAIGRERFSGSSSKKDLYWHEYGAFIDQARTYLRAANSMTDHSACLMYYYAAMNLAKAELLSHNQTIPIGFKWNHGLSHRTDTDAKAVTDSIQIQAEGVFPRLYEKRTGTKIGAVQSFAVKAIVRNILELSTQVEAAGFGPSTVSQGFAGIVYDDSKVWSVIVLMRDSALLNKVTARHIAASYRKVAATIAMCEVFQIAPEYLPQLTVFESSRPTPFGGRGELSREAALNKVSHEMPEAGGVFEVSINSFTRILAAGSARSDKFLALPPSLARYAAFFYGSSVVRYRPSRLSNSADPEASYLFDALCRESALPLMLDALVGLRGNSFRFSSTPVFAA
jgi:hypothetical protein